MKLIFEIIAIIILLQFVFLLGLHIKNRFYDLFKGFWERRANYWADSYKELKYDYDDLKGKYKELWEKTNGIKTTED